MLTNIRRLDDGPACIRSFRWGALGVGLLLQACSTLTPDAGMQAVKKIASESLPQEVVAIRNIEDTEAARAWVERLRRRPLTADAAVQIALLNNRGLQAAYNELGIAEAIQIEASLPPNPTISIERLASAGTVELEARIVGSVLSLATLPARAAIAKDRFREAQLRAASETLRIAAEARRAHYRAVAARQTLALLSDANDTAETAAKLARRMGESGALNKLDQAREQVFYAETTGELARTRQAADSTREALIRMMGLWGSELAFNLPRALPALPPRPRSLPLVETEAVKRRLDLHMARIEVEAMAKAQGLTDATRFVSLLELSGASKTSKVRATGEMERARGAGVELRVPLFDLGEARSRKATESYRRAVNLLAERAVNVRSEARDAYRRYRTAYDIAALYRNEVLPLRKVISDETLLRYNGMQIDVFTLLTDARQRIAATRTAIDAQRDFWLASVDLQAAVTAGGGGGASPERAITAAADAAPADH